MFSANKKRDEKQPVELVDQLGSGIHHCCQPKQLELFFLLQGVFYNIGVSRELFSMVSNPPDLDTQRRNNN